MSIECRWEAQEVATHYRRPTLVAFGGVPLWCTELSIGMDEQGRRITRIALPTPRHARFAVGLLRANPVMAMTYTDDEVWTLRVDGFSHVESGSGCEVEFSVAEMQRVDWEGGLTMTEAAITINGRELSPAQSMVIRCAVVGMLTRMVEHQEACGTDAHGIAMRRMYCDRLAEVQDTIHSHVPERP